MRHARLTAAALACLLLGGATRAGEVFELSGQVRGATSKHTVLVALWRADGFLAQPVQSVRIPPGSSTHFRFEVPTGRWALSAFEDVNENGILDMGLFGPKEPSGFFKPFSGWHRPSFDEVAFELRGALSGAEIALK